MCSSSKPTDGNEDGEAKKPPVTYVPPEPTENEDEMFGSSICTGINFDKFDNIAVKVCVSCYLYNMVPSILG